MDERHGVGRSPISSSTLDFLRGIAACYVVVNHVRGALFAGGSAMLAAGHDSLFDKIAIAGLSLTSLGQEFVTLFFVLSGTAIAHSVQFSTHAGSFLVRRAVRVWLPYLVAIAFAVLVCLLLVRIAPHDARAIDCRSTGYCQPARILGALFYLDPTTDLTPQFWSLPYEILFYLLAPIILASKRTINVAFGLSALATACSIGLYGLRFNPSASVVANFVLQELFLFMIGAFFYVHFDKALKLGGRSLIAMIAAVFVFTIAFKTWYGDSNVLTNIVMALATTIVIKSLPVRLAKSRLNAGKYSYSIYIFHYAILAIIVAVLHERYGIQQADITSYVAWMGALPPIFAATWLLWFISERPSIHLLAKMRSRENARLQAAKREAMTSVGA